MTPEESEEINRAREYAEQVRKTSLCIIPNVIDQAKIDRWYASFLPLMNRHIEREGHRLNRGPHRYYITLPFIQPFADPEIFENDIILSVVEQLVGKDGVMCQLATDTPLKGSEYQEIHRDTQLLFPETGKETPPYQLAVNFPLVGRTCFPKRKACDSLKAGKLSLNRSSLKRVMLWSEMSGICTGEPQTKPILPARWLLSVTAAAGYFARKSILSSPGKSGKLFPNGPVSGCVLTRW